MKTIKEREFIKVIPQFTISPNTISLISEEEHISFNKGSLVMQVSRDKLSKMARPLKVEIIRRKEKVTEKIITKIVLK